MCIKKIKEYLTFSLLLLLLAAALNFRIVFVEGVSMQPTLWSGDVHLFCCSAEPKEGDIVVLEAPRGDGFYVKRITDVPGDTLLHKGEPLTLDENQFYVCGDNREASYDSRYFGPISEDALKGVMLF